eukprot:TRINITY_DN53727_c0_g1_i1.p1 TRINITY_DN53727_c0_g1~~TRINITY_DN53727_c0_g1_i1.p1  ORF type:complete len:277 (-),score=74.62 TRINITY_DN53727_c0_g1_i1:53-883(-)
MGSGASSSLSAALGALSVAELGAALESMTPEQKKKVQAALECTTSKKPSYKLIYLNARGRAELSRVMFTVTGTPFEDVRYPISYLSEPPWVVKDEFNKACEEGVFDVGMGQLPILEVDGKQIGQSMAVERFVARSLGLVGSDDVEAAQIEQVCETQRDMRMVHADKTPMGGKMDPKDQEAFFNEKLPSLLKKLEKSLPPAADGPWLVGSKMSYADLCMFVFLAMPGGVAEHDPFLTSPEGCQKSYQECPRLKASIEAVGALPVIKDYIANQKATLR